jgi:hypothetical protein
MYFYKSVCTNCGKERVTEGGKADGYWGLSNHYGIRGTFCGECYEKVSHDSYGKPNHPGEYIAILLKQTVVQ